MGDVIELSLLPQLDQHAAKEWDHVDKIRVLFDNFFECLVCFLEILMIEILLGLNEANIE